MNSVILQVDESTKGLMEEIQSGITSSIEDGIREVKNKVNSVDNNTDLLIRKFKNFDGLTCAIDQLRSLAEESKKFVAIVSPLENSVSELKQGNKAQEQFLSQVSSNVELLVKGVVELGERHNNYVTEIKGKIQSALSDIKQDTDGTKNLLNEVLSKLSQDEQLQQKISSKIDSSLSTIIESINELKRVNDEKIGKLEVDIMNMSKLQAEFSENYAANESSHRLFENSTTTKIEDISKSLEKLQAILNIIVNIITPFWKKNEIKTQINEIK